MEKFKVGQKVYCINYGLGEVAEIKNYGPTPVECKFSRFTGSYNPQGKFITEAENPTLLTLEEARAKGYDVPKQKIVKEENLFLNGYADGRRYLYPTKQEALALGYAEHTIKAVPVTIKYEVEE